MHPFFFRGPAISILLFAATLTGQPQLTGSGPDSVVIQQIDASRQPALPEPYGDTVLTYDQLSSPPQKKNAFTISISADGGDGFYLSPLNISYEIKRRFGIGIGGTLYLWEGATISPAIYYLHWPVDELVATGASLTGNITFTENTPAKRYYGITLAHITRAYISKNIFLEGANGFDIGIGYNGSSDPRFRLSQGIRIGYSAPVCRNKLYDNGLYKAFLITAGTLQAISIFTGTIAQSILFEWD